MKLALFIAAAGAAAALQASAVQYDFGTIHSSSGTPGGTAPYARLTVDQVSANVVSMKLEALSLDTEEFISFFKYNLDGAANLVTVLDADDGAGGVSDISYAFLNSPATDASLTFDGVVNFSTQGGPVNGLKRFTDGESIFFTLTAPGLVVDDIDLDMMIHIQGIDGGGSAKVIATTRPGTNPPPPTAVPDAGSSVALLGLGALGVWAARRR